MNTTRWTSAAHILLRIVAGLLLLHHGGQKLFGWFGGLGPGITVRPLSEMGIAGILEFYGGAALLLGFLTRPVAFLLSGEMAVAYFTAHSPHGFWPIQNKGELAVAYCFAFLFIAARGSGIWSVDGARAAS